MMGRLSVGLFLLGALCAVVAGVCVGFQAATMASCDRRGVREREPETVAEAGYEGCMSWIEEP
jgi:hypothetical protein